MPVDFGAIAVTAAASTVASLLVWKIRRDDNRLDKRLEAIEAKLADKASKGDLAKLEKTMANGVEAMTATVADKIRLTVLEMREADRRDR